jgi:ATP adenylyltransferase
MEHLWAPWRNTYVKDGTKHEGNIFGRIAQGTDDEANFVLTRGKACFAILNLYPYNTGHLMILPYRQTGALEDLSDDETLEMMTMLKRMKAAITAAFRPDGFNVGINLGAAAGAGIEQHLHIHLVPRWRNDANFMTTTAETRIHPSDLPSVFAAIKKQL